MQLIKKNYERKQLVMEKYFGIHVAQTLLRYRAADIESVLLSDIRKDQRLSEIERLARKHGIRIKRAPKRDLAEHGSGIKHQGVVVLCRSPVNEVSNLHLSDWMDALPSADLLVALEEISDPRNLGACLRSASAAGVGGVILPRSRGCSITSTVSRTAAGAAETMSILSAANLARTIDALKTKDYFVVGLDESADTSIYSLDFQTPTVLVFGAEDTGLRVGTRNKCDQLASIPMFGKISSLNVSVAVGVATFEVVRQRLLAQ